MAIYIRRREFIFALGGAAAAWPLAAHAQQSGHMRRIGFISAMAEKDRKGSSMCWRFKKGCASAV
jgi:putative ABC transport system substrate-binding protein